MTAPSKNFTVIADTAVDVSSPITQDLMTQIRDNTIHLEEWLGDSYTAAKNHNHDGTNSALVEVGPNYQRNGSFESGLTEGWTFTAFTTGSYVLNTSQEMDGQNCAAFTSTVLADGGGDAISAAFTNVTASGLYSFKCSVKASVINVSSKFEAIWYDDTQAQISASTVFSSTNTSTSQARRGRIVRAPSTAKYVKLKITGGVPASGSAVGTIYFDGVVMSDGPHYVEPGTVDYISYSGDPIVTSSTVDIEVKGLAVQHDGTYTVRFQLSNTTGSGTANGRIYVNGVATGTARSTTGSTFTTYDEDIAVLWGDAVQIFASHSTGGANSATVMGFGLMGVAA